MTERLTKLKASHPERASRLDRIVAPLIGQTLREEGRIARESLDFVEARILAALFGDDDVPHPTSSVTIP